MIPNQAIPTLWTLRSAYHTMPPCVSNEATRGIDGMHASTATGVHPLPWNLSGHWLVLKQKRFFGDAPAKLPLRLRPCGHRARGWPGAYGALLVAMILSVDRTLG